VLQIATVERMKTISQRELRNDNAEIMRGVEMGETYTVTRRGVPIARIVPISEPELKVDRPARRRSRFSDLPLVKSTITSEEILNDLRGDR
jgi:prevent-host-death family protein